MSTLRPKLLGVIIGFTLIACGGDGADTQQGGAGLGGAAGLGTAGLGGGAGNDAVAGTAGVDAAAGAAGWGTAGTAGSGTAGSGTAGSAGIAGTAGTGPTLAAGEILYRDFTEWNSFQIGSCPDIATDRHGPLPALQKLATTNEEVRILVYGQSLSMGDWVDGLRNWLHQQYPNGNLKLESHARAGCSARCLVGGSTWDDPVRWTGMGVDPDPNASTAKNRLPGDVFSWHPDLIIFHVLTDYKEDYALLMAGFTSGCAAFAGDPRESVHCTPGVDDAGYVPPQVLVQTDPRTTEESYPTASAWKTDINEVFVPGEVTSHGYVLADNWMDWKGFLDHTGIPRTDLELSPGNIHFSPQGHQLMTKTTAQHLCYP